MSPESAVTALSRLSERACGVFRVDAALSVGVTRNQLARFTKDGLIERMLPGTYRMVAVAPSPEQRLRAALLWAGADAAAAGRSAGERYRLEGVRVSRPEIVVPHGARARTSFAIVTQGDPRALMIRTVGGVRTTGVEATLVRLAHLLDDEAFEIACEDARHRRLTSMTALRTYLQRHGRRGRPGISALRQLLEVLDPEHPARSTLEVKTRRLLVASGIDDFVREFPLSWNGRTFRYDFALPERRVILETNGRRWHDDAADYERDNEKWSVPARCGYRIVFATWDKVTRSPADLIAELMATLAA